MRPTRVTLRVSMSSVASYGAGSASQLVRGWYSDVTSRVSSPWASEASATHAAQSPAAFASDMVKN
jgi:hypothetical protein